MPYIPKTKEQVLQTLTGYFEIAGFDNIIAGTPEHALLEMMTNVLHTVYADIQNRYQSLLPLDAEGEDLDAWVSFFGAERALETYAKDETLTNVYFYITDSERLSVNEGNAVTIPAGVYLSDSTGAKRYRTTSEATILANGNSPYVAFVSVEAISTGFFSNILVHELVSHNLQEVAETSGISGIDSIGVDNKFAISSGTFPERDADVHMTLQSIFAEHIGTNLEGILDKLYALPGARYATISPAKRGTGTFNVFLDATTPIITPTIIQDAQAILDSECALGTKGYVEYPVYKAVSLSFEILVKDGVDANALLESLEAEISPIIVNSINNIVRGEILDPSILLHNVLTYENVLNAKIKEMKIGTYSVMEDKVINNEMVGFGRKELDMFEKWFSSTDLINYCTVEYE